MKYKLTIDLTINDEWATGDKSVDLELFEDMIQSFNEKFLGQMEAVIKKREEV